MKYCVIALLSIVNCGFVFAGDLNCVDLIGDLVPHVKILSKISPQNYEAQVFTYGNGQFRAFLHTERTEFTSSGLVHSPFYVENNAPEFVEVETNNGFKEKEKVRVYHESVACISQETPKALAREKKSKEKAAKDKAAIQEFNRQEHLKYEKIWNEQKNEPFNGGS